MHIYPLLDKSTNLKGFMKSLNFKLKTLLKILCLFIILINFHIIVDKLINLSYEKSSKINNFPIISNSNSNATQFEDLTYDDQVTWGNNITFSINFTYTEDNGTTWDPVLDSNAYCNITIRKPGLSPVLIKTNMTPLGNGIFFKAINSSRLSTNIVYIVTIEGSYPGYPDPNKKFGQLYIFEILTGISMHNYTTLNELTTNEFSLYYNELINVTFKYYNNNTGNSLIADSFTYQWVYGFGSVNLDPRNSDYYTLEINTSTASNVGEYRIDISASLENYTTINYGFDINILMRPTTLNGENGLISLISKIWVQKAINFTFTYRDAESDEIISDLSEATYLWEEYYPDGTVIPGGNRSGTLIQNINKSYTLDFKTELRQVGYYFLVVTLKKVNYIHKNAIINLEIIPRPTSLNGTTLTLTISKDIEFRTAYNFTFEINNALTHSRIGDLDQTFYYWYRTDSNGTILEGPSQNIDLVKDLNDLYILDFNSELKSVGFYRIHVEFHKENYSSRYAIINITISPGLNININSPNPNDTFGLIAPDFELDIIGSYDTIWYTLDNGDTNITVSALNGTINQIEWDKKENGIISIRFYANNSNGFIGYAVVQFTKLISEESSLTVFGYDLMILLGVISIITLTIKKKIFEKGLKKER